MNSGLSVATAPKTGTYQVRINPEIKSSVEDIYAKCGMTLTDAFNLFLQQTMNVEGLPFIVSPNSGELLREQAINILMSELKKGEESAEKEGWISEEEMMEEFC